MGNVNNINNINDKNNINCHKNIIFSKKIKNINKKLSLKIQKILNDTKLREKLVSKFTKFNEYLRKKNIIKDIKYKIDKKKKQNIYINKFSFTNVKKCLVYSFFYLGKKNKKLQVSNIEFNGDENEKELCVDTVKLLENNIKSQIESNTVKEIKENDTINEILKNLGNNSNKEENKEENLFNSKDIKNLIISSNNITNSIHKSIRISYPEIQQTHNIKIKSPICERCFRLVYIFFDFLKNYITIYCSYCTKMIIYKYDAFLTKITENKNPLLDSCCNKCYISFLYSDKNNIFRLIEKKEDDNYIVLCNNCFDINRNLINFNKDRIIQFEDLIEHKPFIYEKNNNNNNNIENNININNNNLNNNIINNNNNNNMNNQQDININNINNNFNNENNNQNININNLENNNINIVNNFEKNAEEENNKINELLFLLQGYENNINLLDTKITYIPLSLKENFEKKIKRLNQDLYMKKIINNYYNEYNNFITRINMILALNSIIELTSLKTYKLINDREVLNINEKYLMLKKLLKCDKLIQRINLPEQIRQFYNYGKLTKNYLNEEEYLEDNNHSVEEELKESYYDVLNINFITGETIRYNILSENNFCQKIVPISYNYNLRYNSINYQGIILYNFRQDKKLYYVEYNIKYNEIEKDTLIQIMNNPIKNCLKIILINNGNDLFIITKENDDIFNNILNAYYICNFRKKPLISKYTINGEYKIIYNDYTVCIQTKKKLMFMNRIIKKDMNICSGINNIDNININNLGQVFIDEENNNIDNENNNNIINNNNIMNNDNIINNNNIMNNNIMNNNIFNNNNDNIEHIIEFQNNLINALGGDIDLILENIDDLNNLNLPPLHSSSIFQMNEEGIKSNFINIYKISEDYFIVLSLRKIKKINVVLKIYFYMSLFDFKTLEEVTKAEIDMIEFDNNKKFIIDFIQDEDNIKIIINISENGFPLDERIHNIRLNNGEIIDIN